MNHKITIESLLRKGAPIALIGTSEAGKTTFVSGLAKSEAVETLLATRMSHGKGGLIPAGIVVTDDPRLDDAAVYAYVAMAEKLTGELNDDHELLTDVLFSAAKEQSKPAKSAQISYADKIANSFDYYAKLDAANNSLGYKLAVLPDTGKLNIKESIAAFPSSIVNELYQTAKEKQNNANKKGNYARKEFQNLLNAESSLKPFIDAFWQTILNEMNSLKNDLLATLEIEFPKDRCFISDDKKYFMIELQLSDMEKHADIVNHLLKSESESREYLFSELVLIFKGDDDLFNQNRSDCFTVMTLPSGANVHVIRFIDTMGLFHEPDVNASDECARVIDILSDFSVSTVFFISSALVTSKVKDGYQVFTEFMSATNRSVNVYVVETKTDMLLSQEANEISSSFREKGKNNFNVVKAEAVIEAQNRLFLKIADEAVTQNTARFKPSFCGVFRYGMPKGQEKVIDYLYDNAYDYYSCISKLLSNIANASTNNQKIRISTNGSDSPSIHVVSSNASVPQSAIADINSVTANISLLFKVKTYGSTVLAVVRKGKLGYGHESNIQDNIYGYMNIKATFPNLLTNYGNSLAKATVLTSNSIQLSNRSHFKTSEDEVLFLKLLSEKLTVSVFGRKFAGYIFKNAYQNAFNKNPQEWHAQWERLGYLLDYLRTHYGFSYSTHPSNCSSNMKADFESTIRDCANEILNENCVIVY